MDDPSFSLGALRATLPEPTFLPAAASAKPGVRLLRGRETVAARAGMLQELCRRTGQAGAMDSLEFLLSAPTALEKIPTLILVGADRQIVPAEAQAGNVAGAVLLYEYRMAGLGTKVFATDDVTGLRTVMAPPGLRMQVAEAACEALLEQGALTAIISLAGSVEAYSVAGQRRRVAACSMAKRTRSMPWYLPLAETYEATLANLGRHTRRNLRYYRRRAESEMGAEFVPSVTMGRKEFLAINHASTNPVPDATAHWRYDAIERMRGIIFAGVRTRNGRWLSLIGGRRHLGLTEVDWQINLAGLPGFSLSTVMRSYLLQHEVELGTKQLAFTGGTPHSMRHSFACMDVADVIALQESTTARMLRGAARWVFPEKNFLGQALRDPELRWTKAWRAPGELRDARASD
jgi:hypothetical protein